MTKEVFGITNCKHLSFDIDVIYGPPFWEIPNFTKFGNNIVTQLENLGLAAQTGYD